MVCGQRPPQPVEGLRDLPGHSGICSCSAAPEQLSLAVLKCLCLGIKISFFKFFIKTNAFIVSAVSLNIFSLVYKLIWEF